MGFFVVYGAAHGICARPLAAAPAREEEGEGGAETRGPTEGQTQRGEAEKKGREAEARGGRRREGRGRQLADRGSGENGGVCAAACQADRHGEAERTEPA